MIGRVRVIMTKSGMEAFSKGITMGYLISKKRDYVYILEDGKKSIIKYHISFWKPYHVEENDIFERG